MGLGVGKGIGVGSECEADRGVAGTVEYALSEMQLGTFALAKAALTLTPNATINFLVYSALSLS